MVLINKMRNELLDNTFYEIKKGLDQCYRNNLSCLNRYFAFEQKDKLTIICDAFIVFYAK